MPKYLPLIALIFVAPVAFGQKKPKWPDVQPHPSLPDSVEVKAHPSYGNKSGFHTWLFGKNYREEWSIPVKVPLLRISQLYGGLIPEKEGGGKQSKSLRLKDKQGREWVLRTVEKSPDKILPPGLKGTFATDWFDDAMSAQHPYGALAVPPLAEAINVPHSHPVIGLVAKDPALGEFADTFEGKLCLLEEREPVGDSDNTPKALEKLVEDNDNRFEREAFVRARLLDLMLADWDRHEDQWRWGVKKDKDKNREYIGVPRDRDQVFHLEEGVLPTIAARSWIDPMLDHFDGDIPRPKWSLFKTRFIQPFPDAQFSYAEWMQIANDFVKAETDAVLEAALKRLPKETYRLRHDVLLQKLKKRRDNIPAAAEQYYRYINRIVDIRVSDKNEKITLTDGPDGGLNVKIQKINKDGELKEILADVNYNKDITQEIRLFLQGGNDQVLVNTNSAIKVRLVGGQGSKRYEVQQSAQKVKVYDKPDSALFIGKANQFSKHLSADTNNVRFVPTQRYSVWMPLANVGLNVDDGLLLGAGFKYTGKNGFRKMPYTTVQQLMVTHAFATEAFRIRYNGEWIDAIGKADFTLQAYIQAPDNTQNFFGFGNNTPLNKFPGFRRYHRTRYNTYQLDPQLRFHLDSMSTISLGPSLQYYSFDGDDNVGRFINQTALLHSPDSAIIPLSKVHAGLTINYINNHRDNEILPKSGYYISIGLEGYRGLNQFSQAFAQIRPEFTFYQKLNSKGTIVLTDRVGGGITVSKPAFYQGMYLGGQGNLLGYVQYRFAGKHMLYNNLQARVKVANVTNYILAGQFGFTGFFDTGRVWADGEKSNRWHTGTGGGIYFSPFGLATAQFLMGHSVEGWYPYVSLGLRL